VSKILGNYYVFVNKYVEMTCYYYYYYYYYYYSCCNLRTVSGRWTRSG